MPWILFVALLLCGPLAHAGGYTPPQLGRAVGPFQLGMNEARFQELTGIQPGPCGICLPEERLATLEGPALARILPAAGDDGVMDFFFYRGRLYQFTLTPREEDLTTLARRLSDQFMAPPEHSDPNPEVGQLRWRDETTQVTLNYAPGDRRVYAINYYDLPGLQAREAALAARDALAASP